MIKFTSLTLKNFLSYGAVPTVFPLDKPGTTLILGEDLDNTESGAGANGVGKTVMINALVYAIYDKPISNISKDNLVNNINKKNMEVSISFILNGTTYTIKRFRKTKAGAAGNYVQLFEGDKDITPDSVGNTNRLIEKIIGIPYEIFVRVVAFSATLVPFLDLPVRSHYAANQTDIIEELFDLKTLSEKAIMLKEVIKDTESSLKTHTIRMDQLQQEIDRHDIQIESAKRRVDNWKVENIKEIDEIVKKLKKAERVDIRVEQALNVELTDINNELQEKIKNQCEFEVSLKQILKKKKQQEEELVHLSDERCPYCLQKYKDAEKAITDCKDKVEAYTSEINTLSIDLEVVDNEVEQLTVRYKSIREQITVSDVDELIEIKSKTSVYQNRLKELQQATNPYIDPLQELEDVNFDTVEMDKINELTTLIEHQKFLLKLLTKKDSFVRKTLLNKNIPFLNSRLQHYLSELGLPHTVEFTHEMTASISQFGRDMDFGNLSSGQRARVNLALSFAFRDVLQNRTDRINVCMLDEVLDVGLDTVGVQNAARLLKRKAREEGLSVFIISHRDEVDSAFDNKMVIQMEKGFSYVTGEE